jgi:hypothetical protein
MEKFLVEHLVPKSIIDPVDLNTAANTGNRINMKDVKRVSFIINLGAGTTTAAHSIALKQHIAASGGTPLALEVDNPYFHKVGAATEFTKVEQSVAEDTYDLHALLSNSKAVVVFEVLAEQLSKADDYKYISLDIADTGGAQIGSVIALVEHEYKPAYDKAV